MSWGYEWRPYVSVATRRLQAVKKMDVLKKKGLKIQPIKIEGRKITRTFWGDSWCKHLESYSDYSNRLPRGRTYVRNGSVCHLAIEGGKITAFVSGSELYEVSININALSKQKWNAVIKNCSGQIGSLLELLRGTFSAAVMNVVTDRKNGLFPSPSEIKLDCSCPDWATMCKHVAAVLYGVGARFDSQPDLLFQLRGVNHEELISHDAALSLTSGSKRGQRRIADSDLANVFGIDLVEEIATDAPPQKKTTKQKAATASLPARNSVVAIASRKAKSITNTNSPAIKKAPTRKAALTTSSSKVTPTVNSTINYVWPPTGKTVRTLRTNLELNKKQLAELLDVSPSSVNNWESTRGRLKLLDRTLEALEKAAKLTKKQAHRKLGIS
jgi:uncharacterized Zn finger protein/DNA-binding XRE family transcriptional regulator